MPRKELDLENWQKSMETKWVQESIPLECLSV